MQPITLRERVDRMSQDLRNDPALMGGVLSRLIEKKASDQVPAEVLKMAAEVEKSGGLGKEAALDAAWATYLRYVNPDYAKQAGGKIPPQFQKHVKGKDGKKSDKKDDKKGGKKGSQPPWKKKAELKSAEARELAEKLGMDAHCAPVKKAPPTKAVKKAEAAPKSPEARELAEKLAGTLSVRADLVKELAKALGV